MFPLERSIKGRTAEAVATIIFERGGYRLARFGIEELFREVKLLKQDEYAKLGLDERLRSLPDFLVSTASLDLACQVEVKFRGDLYMETRQELAATLKKQREYWPATHVLLLVGYSPNGKNAKFFQDYVRVIPPSYPIENITKLREHGEFWSQLPQVADIFTLLKKSHFDLDTVVPFLKELKKLTAKDSSQSS